MRRVAVLLSVAAIVFSAAGVMAQGKPSFAGKWTLVPDPNAAAGGGGGRGRGMGGGWGQEPTITQDATTLTVEYMGGGQTPTPQKQVFKLDGSESKNMMPGRGGAEPTPQISKATWDGNKLNIATTITFGENTIEIKRVLSLEGGNLVIETISPGREGGAGTTTKTTYKKS